MTIVFPFSWNFVYVVKGTVSVISSDLPFIEWHVRFTTIPLKPLLDLGFGRYSYLSNRKSSAKKPRQCTYTVQSMYSVTSSLLQLNTLHMRVSTSSLSGQKFEGQRCKLDMHFIIVRSLEITHTFP